MTSTVIDELEALNMDAEHAREAAWIEKAMVEKGNREEIEAGLDTVYREAETDAAIEGTKELQKKLEDRFGVPIGEVVSHFRQMDERMRADPIGGLSDAQQFFKLTAGTPATRMDDLKPGKERAEMRRMAEIAEREGDSVRGAVAKAFLETKRDAEDVTRLKEATAGLPNVEGILKRIVDISETAARDPSLAAAQWAEQAGFTKAINEQFVSNYERRLNTDFSDLEPYSDHILAMIDSGELVVTGNPDRDLRMARGLIRLKMSHR